MPRDDEIFGDALELPPAQRAAFLAQRCAGDPAQEQRIAELLREADQAGDFLRPRGDLLAPAPSPDRSGDVIGSYVLQEKLGEGGWGVVYRATQTTPVRREVALKLIKPGIDLPSVITRFEAERQALALMDHPGIARVFDAGSTPDGRSYFVMELVSGLPITRYCDERSLSLAGRLELFVAVCLAVQHAHQKGVIHRDLKPSNIIVSTADGAPQPKVIDFGIAKAMHGHRLTDETLHTRVGQLMGTPSYMSPEQTSFGAIDIDTRSDIYSLGALLYRLLIGRTPHAVEGGDLAAAWHALREIEPPRPSAAFAMLPPEERTRVATRCATGPAPLQRALRGDLDWIVMRCLAKERSRRYDTAQDLAEDVRRHLRQEPVIAGPPDLRYRAGKFLRRHRTTSIAAAGLVAALVAGTVVSLHQAALARRERDAASAARQAEAEARADAQRRQDQAEEAMAFMLGDFRAELKKLGRLDLLDAVGGKALAYFDALPLRDLTDTALARQARALTQLGDVRMEQRRFEEAEKNFAAAYARAAALAARHPADGELLFERGQAEFWLGAVRRKRGDLAGAATWLTHYRDTAAALVALDPASPRWRTELISGHHNLAVLELDRGRLDLARAAFLAERTAVDSQLAAEPQNRELQFKLTNVDALLGEVAGRQGHYAEAIARFERRCAGLETLARTDPGTALWSYRLADGRMWLAEALGVTGQLDEAAANLARARQLIDQLVDHDPTNRRWQLAALDCRLAEATVQTAANRAPEALATLRELLPHFEALASADPDDATAARRVLTTCWRAASLALTTGAPDAPALRQRAALLADRLAVSSRLDDRMRADCARAWLVTARAATLDGEPTVARAAATKALALLEPRLAANTDWRLCDPAARALLLCGRDTEARRLIDLLTQGGYRPYEPWPPTANP